MEDYIDKPHHMFPTFSTLNTKTNLMNPGIHKLLNNMTVVQTAFARKSSVPAKPLDP
jgi:hypothetical protein